MKIPNIDGDRAIRISTAGTVLALAGVAAYISYTHIHDLCVAYGEKGAAAIMTPFTVDGMVFVASMVLLDAAKKRQRAPWLARLCLVAGVLATLAANVIHGLSHGIVGAVISAWPAIALVFAFELAMGMIRRGSKADKTPDLSAVTEDPIIAKARQMYADRNVPGIRQLMSDLRVGYKNAKMVKNALGEVA